MSKGSKSRRSQARKANKRNAKAARRALYLSYAEQGRSNNKGGDRRAGPTNGRKCHLMADCGNPGCKRCNPQLARPNNLGILNVPARRVCVLVPMEANTEVIAA